MAQNVACGYRPDGRRSAIVAVLANRKSLCPSAMMMGPDGGTGRTGDSGPLPVFFSSASFTSPRSLPVCQSCRPWWPRLIIFGTAPRHGSRRGTCDALLGLPHWDAARLATAPAGFVVACWLAGPGVGIQGQGSGGGSDRSAVHARCDVRTKGDGGYSARPMVSVDRGETGGRLVAMWDQERIKRYDVDVTNVHWHRLLGE